MVTKLFEIRDEGTFIPAMAVRVSGDDGYLMRRAGFQSPMIYLVMLATQKCAFDPWSWSDRTMQTAHLHIEKEFDRLEDGAVIDVEFLLGETAEPKLSEEVA